MSLYIYKLNWEYIDGGLDFFFTESFSEADARQDGPWEFSSPEILTNQGIYNYCNDQWSLPEESGEEILSSFYNIIIYRTAKGQDDS